MACWLQKSDLSAEDLPSLDKYSAFETYFDSLNIVELDAQFKELESPKGDWCPWGIGMGMDGPNGIHVTRDDVDKQTYCVLRTHDVTKKFLGFIPMKKNVETYTYDLSASQMKAAVREFYEDKHKLSLDN